MAMRMAISLLLLLLAQAPGALLAATDPDVPRLVNVGAEAGLPVPVVSALGETRDGFLWVGSARGLARFDGMRFRIYANGWVVQGGETSLFVRSILVARDGALWVGTDFAGLVRYDPVSDALVPFDLGEDLPRSWSVNALAEDRQGRIWIGTDGLGLVVLDPRGRVRRIVRADDVGLPDDVVTSLLIDDDGRLWVGTRRGLVSGDPDDGRFSSPTPVFSRMEVSAMLQSGDGQMWIGSSEGFLWRLPPDATVPLATDARGGAPVRDLLQASDATIWVAADDGLQIRALKDGALLHRLSRASGDPDGLGGDEVRALLKDRGGQIWIGSYGGGLQRYNPYSHVMYRLDRRAFSHLGEWPADPDVRSLATLHDGRVLLGTQTHGVLILDASLRPIDTLRDQRGQALFLGDRVSALAQDADGSLWIGATSGLYRQTREGGPVQSFGRAFGAVRRLLADPRGDLWIGSQEGILRHRRGSDALEPSLSERRDAIDWRDVNAIGIDPQGRIWFGGDAGLGMISAPGERARHIVAAHPARGDVSDVLGLLVDADGSIWFDTPSGLFRLWLEADGTERVDAISARHGGAGQPFGANLMKDAQGRLWTQTHMYDPQLGRIVSLGAADGADGGRGWFRAMAKATNGRLLFGWNDGLLVVNPEAYRIPDYDPPLVLSELRVAGRSVPVQPALGGLTLRPHERSLQLEFASLDYSDPEKVRYRYRLLGEDPDWNETDAGHRFASYSNLAPGAYQFELRGSDRLGRFSPQPLVIPIRVQPAWWQTWWARAAALLMIVALIALLMRQRTRWLTLRQAELEESVAHRTRELQALSQALQEKSRALEEASLTDPLTGLRNRRYFTEHLAHWSHGGGEASAGSDRRAGDAHGMVFFLLDVDHFKQVNDLYGHAAGDAVLVQVAARLQRCVRAQDCVVRWGGEEFLVVADGISMTQVAALAERLVEAIREQPFSLPDHRYLRRTCSLGYAPLPLQARWPRQVGWEDVIELADRAMYAVKRSGRNGWLGIEGGDAEPLSPTWCADLVAELDAGRLLPRGALDLARVRDAWSVREDGRAGEVGS